MIPNLPPADPPLKPYDVLIVNDYIANGLYPSGIDQFFEVTPVPQPSNYPHTITTESLHQIAFNARQALKILREKKPLDYVSSLLI